MPMISVIGRRQPKVRLLIASLYALLAIGAIATVYPFLLMLSGSTKSAADAGEASIVPRFWYDEQALYRKHLEGLFNESLTAIRVTYDVDVNSFDKIAPPSTPMRELVAEWNQFLEATDPKLSYAVGYFDAPVSKTTPSTLRGFKAHLVSQYGADIEQVNRALETDFAGWNNVVASPEQHLLRRDKPGGSAIAQAVRSFQSKQPRDLRYYFSVEGFFKNAFLKSQYTRDISEYNAAHDTRHSSYDDVHLESRFPAHSQTMVRADWEQFVRSTLNLLWIRVDAEAAPLFTRFLRAKYHSLDILNKDYGARFRSFEDVPLTPIAPDSGTAASDWEAFLQGWRDTETGEWHVLPIEMVRVQGIDFQFRDHLQKKYPTIADLNLRLGTAYRDYAKVRPPQRDAHYLAFRTQMSELRLEHSTRNLRAAIDYVVIHGRGILNTVIYCALAVVCAVLFNPLAAYALSRYAIPGKYKVLLFLLLPMAFPGMVTQIPTFLTLRHLGLLNSFAALILPGLVTGYSIFLLKGFFDSLPRELYESAALDGAGEWAIFWQITMSLSKPILAVIALSSFGAAYANFLFALLLCQDEKMWTLMVWLYQLQQRAGVGVIYSSLVIAAVPTLLVFLFAQNVIMRGVIIPSEK